MIRVSIDEAKLRRSLERAAKNFGDTTRQAVARLAVQTARELANSTQAHIGIEGGPKKAQWDAIGAGMRAVVVPLEGLRVKGSTVEGTLKGERMRFPVRRYLSSAAAVNDWVDQRRTRRRGRTPKRVPMSEVGVTSNKIFNQALTIRKRRAGIAKGGWVGAGQKAAQFQRGGQRITIGKNFLGYTQKHGARFGAARQGGSGLSPTITLSNNARHSGDRNVLSPKEIYKGIHFAAFKTLKWYRRAAKEALDKA